MVNLLRLAVAVTVTSTAAVLGAPTTAEEPHGILLDASALSSNLSPLAVEGFTPQVTDKSDLDARALIGPDNRVNWNSTEYPYNAMVQVEWVGRGICSGVLIGPRHVATARTCAPQIGETGQQFKFKPNFHFGERFPSAGMINWYIDLVGFGDCVVKDDWAIFILDKRLGEQLGYLGAKVFNPATQLNKAQFFSYGWPADKSFGFMQPTRQEGISVKSMGTGCEPGGSLRTDADAAWGQKGAPLWAVENGSRYVYGVMQDETASADYTPFAGGQNFVNSVGKTRADYP
ncbi:trypsin-like cysteine/serine peptidase domain-containing protein [Podospora aff. communis PSN243]|uniref:Trypsin-like cysteine/serine peptidase domain-containing protein n=1 Tax=Podospora aff. communis PSN243 TaxID=3040156 RepID=A0AAV9G522_9PEZI|nr:trypsin-like cysteine/serine peptidase domain-containing protein [Podospora aff. communis PSN243]